MPYCKNCGHEVQERVVMCPKCGQRQVGGGSGGKKGVILAVAIGCGCLGIVGLGMFSAILIPNLIDALQKAKQKRTMADVRHVGTAMMSWYTDQVDTGNSEWTLSEYPSAEELSQILVPEYIQEVPATDGWKHPLEYRVRSDLLSSQVFRIRSPGRDGAWEVGTAFEAGGADEGEEYDVMPFLATDYDRDIVWSDGYFVRYPQSYGNR